MEWRCYHIPHGAGPNGPGALWRAPQDFVTLEREFPEIWGAVRRLGGSRFCKTADQLLGEVLPALEGLVPTEPGIPARVAAIPDKGGKVRIIALGSYPVQTVNKPFHDLVFEWLENLFPQDMTHHQGGFIDMVRS